MVSIHLARLIWKLFHPLFIPQDSSPVARRGRPRANARRAFLGICYVLWTGCSWRASLKSALNHVIQSWQLT